MLYQLSYVRLAARGYRTATPIARHGGAEYAALFTRLNP